MTGRTATADETVRLQSDRARHALQLLEQGYSPTQVRERAGLGTRELEQVVALHEQRTGGAAEPEQQLTSLTVAVLRRHPANVRSDVGDLTELEATVREHGVLLPLLVRAVGDAGYVVVDGHRRLAAAIAAGLPRVPVRLVLAHGDGRDLDVDDVETMLVPGLTKATLEPMDEAHAYARLLAAGMTQQEIATRVGKNPGHISQRLALLNLSQAEQDAVRDKTLPVRDAYLAGREHSPRRRTGEQHRPKPKVVPHFTVEHPLAFLARQRCDHPTTLKLGVACGPCWEHEIRADALNTGSLQARPEVVL